MHLSNEEETGCLRNIGDEILPSHVANHETRIPIKLATSMLEGKRVFFVAHLLFCGLVLQIGFDTPSIYQLILTFVGKDLKSERIKIRDLYQNHLIIYLSFFTPSSWKVDFCLPSLKLTAKAPANGWFRIRSFPFGSLPIFRCYVC